MKTITQWLMTVVVMAVAASCRNADDKIQFPSYPVIDVHAHAFARTPEQVHAWLKHMDDNNIERVIVMTGSHGARFDELYDLYTSISDRFDVWCGVDMTGWGTPDFPASAIRELERCWRKGAKGVGELSDRGLGDRISRQVAVPGLHFNDELFVPIFSKCAELGLTVNCHIGEPCESEHWKSQISVSDTLCQYDLVRTMEETCAKNPNTKFIACHFMNIYHDYDFLSGLLDRNPNLYLDNSGRFIETSRTPSATRQFYRKYSDRILFGTDDTPSDEMYDQLWTILESKTENGLGLNKHILEKMYRGNALKLIEGSSLPQN